MLLASFNISAQEITPGMFSEPANTGANMTVGVNASVFNQFEGGLIGAFIDLNGDGTLQCVGLEIIQSGFFGLALWGDDSSTPIPDGLGSSTVPQFAILFEPAMAELYLNLDEASDNFGWWSWQAQEAEEAYYEFAPTNASVFTMNEIPQFTGYVTNGIVNINDAALFSDGCEDENACNYTGIIYENVNYTYNCEYPQQYYDCSGNCINDTDGDLVCNENEIPGCQDPLYLEYNPNATDPGDCLTEIVMGCTNPIAINYNPAANVDDGSCLIEGCINDYADNYNFEAI